MRRAATILSWIAGLMILGLGIWLLVGQPSIDEGWMTVWADEMELGSPFDMPNAATIMGILGIVFGGITVAAAAVMPRRFVLGGILIVVMDMLACGVIAISPDPKWGVLVWALPGFIMAMVGFLLGMELQRVQEPEGVAELE